jgi:hypothetical protein
MNTIAAINDILLPVVLFVIYFCLVSVVLYNLKEKTDVSTDQKATKTSQRQPKSFTYRDAFSSAFDPEPIPENSEEIVALIQQENVADISPEITDEQSLDAPTTTPSTHQSIPEIIDSLGKRDIRKLCVPLGIQQKTNGTELTTELMKALVKRKFKENPVQVIEVMSDRLPAGLPTFPKSNQQQQLDSLAC